MTRIYDCIAGEHNLVLVLLALAICLAACRTGVLLQQRSRTGDGTMARLWCVTAGLVTGSGIWATHFVAMLAFEPGPPVTFDLALTVLSLALSILVTMLGYGLRQQPRLPSIVGGIVVGLAIVAMHYTGMQAMRGALTISWSPGFVLASLVPPLVLVPLALRVAQDEAVRHRAWIATLLLILAITGLHFIGMGALVVGPLPAPVPAAPDLPNLWLAVGISLIVLFILGAAFMGIVFDRILEQRDAREHQRVRRLLEATPEGILTTCDGVVTDANPALIELLGFKREMLVGAHISLLLPPAELEAMMRLVEQSDRPCMEIEVQRVDGSFVPVEILVNIVVEDGRRYSVASVRDISVRRAAQARINYLAHHDPLTGLPNRAAFEDRFATRLALAERRGEKLAVLWLDLDRFKDVNDTMGHAVGDSLLKHVATLLEDNLRDNDLVARVGGDEFVVVLGPVPELRAGYQLAERLIEQIRDWQGLDGLRGKVGFSIGMSAFPDHGQEAETLLRKADVALYQAKAEGRGRISVYATNTDEMIREKRELEQALRHAIERDELELHYQSQIDAASGAITGFEALVRWPHPTRGLMQPDDFIPLAEKSGLIRPLGTWVLRRACRDAMTWPEHLRVAVNLSPIQFQHDELVGTVDAALEESGLDPARLELEITESVLISETSHALDVLEALKKRGVRIAMDDFGTGYSSLSHLQRFPFDRIKIDRSFVARLGEHAHSTSIIKAILGLGQGLHIDIVAEGVETEIQRSALIEEGCQSLQGFAISEPLPLAELRPFLDGAKAGGAPALAPPSMAVAGAI